MAETLTLGVPKKIALDSTPGNVTEVVVPAGTRHLKGSSESAWFVQVAGEDASAGDADAQFRYDPGSLSDKWPGMGLEDDSSLRANTSFFIAGSVADQELWLWAITETG